MKQFDKLLKEILNATDSKELVRIAGVLDKPQDRKDPDRLTIKNIDCLTGALLLRSEQLITTTKKETKEVTFPLPMPIADWITSNIPEDRQEEAMMDAVNAFKTEGQFRINPSKYEE